MQQYSHCPVCGNSISEEKRCGQLIVCDCGWTHSVKSNHTEKKGVDRVVFTMILVCSLFVGSFIHAVNWDTYFFAIIPLKLKQYTGMASEGDLKRVIQICSERSKHDCVEKAYLKMFAMNPSKIEVLAELGHVQFLREDLRNVAATLDVYFQKGGKSVDAAYDYARALTETGRLKDSLKYFKYVLNSKPKVFQINVARSYVQTLIKSKHYSQAKVAIEHYRNRSVSSAFFMDKEYKEVLRHVPNGRTVANTNVDVE